MAAYIKPIFGEVCGTYGAKKLWFRNTHPNFTLKVTIVCDYVDDYGKPKKSTYTRVMLPAKHNDYAPNPDTDWEMERCPIDINGQRFDYTVKTAKRV